MIIVSAGCAITAKLVKEAGFDGIWEKMETYIWL